jgi:hypothetical protein
LVGGQEEGALCASLRQAAAARLNLYKRGCFVLESKQFQAATAAASLLELVA